MSCMPARYDFAVYEGVDCKILKTTNNTDITGATIAFTATKERGGASPNIEIAGVIDDATSGKYHIPLAGTDTEGLVIDKTVPLYYDVLITLSNGDIEAETFGVIQLNPRASA